jgi:hypothetical protein
MIFEEKNRPRGIPWTLESSCKEICSSPSAGGGEQNTPRPFIWSKRILHVPHTNYWWHYPFNLPPEWLVDWKHWGRDCRKRRCRTCPAGRSLSGYWPRSGPPPAHRGHCVQRVRVTVHGGAGWLCTAGRLQLPGCSLAVRSLSSGGQVTFIK